MRRLIGYVRRYFLQWLAWRSFALTLVVNQAVTPLIGLAVWSTVAPGRGMFDYFLALLLVRLATSSYESHTFSARVYDGDFADDLLLPHPPVLAAIGENLAIRAWHLLLGLPILGAVLLFGSPAIRLDAVVLALPALALAAVLRFLFTYTLSLSAFWAERAHSIVGLGSTLIFLLGGEAAPVQVLPPAIRPWVLWLPFRAMLGFPAEVAVGGLTQNEMIAGYAAQMVWLALLGALCAAVWRAGIRRYRAVGG